MRASLRRGVLLTFTRREQQGRVRVWVPNMEGNMIPLQASCFYPHMSVSSEALLSATRAGSEASAWVQALQGARQFRDAGVLG